MRSRRRWPRQNKVVWWNVGDGPWEKKAQGLDKLRDRGYLIICLSETGDRIDGLTKWARGNGYRLVCGDGPGALSTVALVHHSVDLRHVASREQIPSTFVGDAGAGPDRTKRKVLLKMKINWLRVFSHHLIPSVEQDHLPNTPLRRRLYRRSVAVLVDWMQANTRPAAAGGDFNARPTFFLLKPLRFARQVIIGATHASGRLIDLVYLSNVRLVESENIEMPSDHNAVGVTVERRRRFRRK